MREPIRDRERLEHIKAAIDRINRYTSDKSYDDLVSDDMMYYAVVKKAYVVTFNKYNSSGALEVLDTIFIDVNGDRTITIPGDLGSDPGTEFEGWMGQDGITYQEGESYTVNSHFDFYLKESGRYWLVFESNAGGPGSGATYTPPQLIYAGNPNTAAPDSHCP